MVIIGDSADTHPAALGPVIRPHSACVCVCSRSQVTLKMTILHHDRPLNIRVQTTTDVPTRRITHINLRDTIRFDTSSSSSPQRSISPPRDGVLETGFPGVLSTFRRADAISVVFCPGDRFILGIQAPPTTTTTTLPFICAKDLIRYTPGLLMQRVRMRACAISMPQQTSWNACAKRTPLRSKMPSPTRSCLARSRNLNREDGVVVVHPISQQPGRA